MIDVPHVGMYCPIDLRVYGLPVVCDPDWPTQFGPSAFPDGYFDELAELYRRN